MSLNPTPSRIDPRLDHRSASQRHEELARDIVGAALVRGRFELRPGIHSDVFIDKYLFEARPSILRRVASELAELLPASTQRLVAHEIGPLPLATAVSLESGLPLSIAHDVDGEEARLSGELHPGDEAVVIEDVVSSGKRALSLVRPLLARRMTVTTVLAAIDREEGGAAAITATGPEFVALLRLRDLDLKSPSPSTASPP